MAGPSFVLWHYSPSAPAAIAFCIIFASLSSTHLTLRVMRGSSFCNPLIVGGIFEVIGYGSRAAAHYNKDSTILYALQSLLLLLAPILFAASAYMFLGRIVRVSAKENLSIIPPNWITKIFVGGDITCFLVQAGGGGILTAAKSQSTFDIGNYVILAGLVLQIAFFGAFIVIAGLFHFQFMQDSSAGDRSRIARQLGSLYTISVLITVRNIYRVLEYGLGQDGYLLTHEWSLYVFDAGLMTLVLGTSITWYWLSVGREKLTSSKSRGPILHEPQQSIEIQLLGGNRDQRTGGSKAGVV